MSESHLHLPDEYTPLFYPEWRKQFRRDLAAAGLERLPSQESEFWSGLIGLSWEDPVTGDYQSADHKVAIEIPVAFPFAKPEVFPCDQDPPIRDNRHQMPGSDIGPLCLWSSDSVGWLPSMTADELLARIRTWFGHYHRNDWDEQDRPPDLHRYFPSRVHPLMIIGDDWQPTHARRFGRFGIWQNKNFRAFAGSPAQDLNNPPFIHTDRILPMFDLAEQRRQAIGLWYRLLREPKPYTNLEKLLQEIDVAADQPKGWALQQIIGLHGIKTQRENTRAILALGYPTSAGQEHWLFVQVNLSPEKRRTRWSRSNFLRAAPIESFETAGAGHDALMRRTGHIASQLQDRKVLIFGQGAIGGHITLLLAKGGIQHMRIVDHDTMKPGNAVRHVGGLFTVGYYKTHAVSAEVQNHAPDCKLLLEETTWDPKTLASWIKETDIVVDATAHLSFSLLLNELCLREERAVIYIAAHRKAAVGRIRIVRPGEDPCLMCYEQGYLGDTEYPIIPPGDEGEFIEPGCGVPTTEASAVDIEGVSNWGARAVLWYFREKLGAENHYLVVNEPLLDARNPLTSIGVHRQRWERLPHCAACGIIGSS